MFDAHANPHGRVAHDTVDGRANQKVVSLLTCVFKFRNLSWVDIQEPQATPCDIDYLCHRRRRNTAVCLDFEEIDKVLFRRAKIRAVDHDQRISCGHAIAGRRDSQLLNITVYAAYAFEDLRLIDFQSSNRADFKPHWPPAYLGISHADLLLTFNRYNEFGGPRIAHACRLLFGDRNQVHSTDRAFPRRLRMHRWVHCTGPVRRVDCSDPVRRSRAGRKPEQDENEQTTDCDQSRMPLFPHLTNLRISPQSNDLHINILPLFCMFGRLLRSQMSEFCLSSEKFADLRLVPRSDVPLLWHPCLLKTLGFNVSGRVRIVGNPATIFWKRTTRILRSAQFCAALAIPEQCASASFAPTF